MSDQAGLPEVEVPPEFTIRKITPREAAHIGMLVETFMDRDAAFMFNFAQAVQLQAKRRYIHERKANPGGESE